MEEEKTRICGRCQKAVAEANFPLHESHCKRFLVLCPDCDENVPRSELQTHREEQHARVKCSKCQKKMEKRLLAEHEEEECPARVKPCVYCELELAWSELQEHVVACGSRTERCLDCGQYVKLSDQEEHDKTCADQDLYNEEPSPPRGAYGSQKTTRQIKVLCKVCMRMFPAEEIKKHEVKCTAAPKWNKEESDSESEDDGKMSANSFLSPRFRGLFQDQSEDLPWTITSTQGASRQEDTKSSKEHDTCPHCQLVLPLSTLRWHERKCQLHKNLKHRDDTVSSYV